MKSILITLGILADGAAVAVSLAAASWLKFDSGIFPGTEGPGPSAMIAGISVSAVYWILFFAVTGCYTMHWDRSWNDEMRMTAKPVTAGMVLLAAITFLAAPGFSVGRWIFLFYYLLTLASVFAARGAMRRVEKKCAERGLVSRRTVIVGTGAKALAMESDLAARPALGYRTIGFVRSAGGEGGPEVPADRILGDSSELPDIIEREGVTEIIITLASNFHDDILSMLLPATCSGVRLKVVPDLFDVIAGHVHNTQIHGAELMEITPGRMPFWQRLAKVVLDYTFSSLVLLVGSPVLLAIALAIKLDSRGTVFYSQTRVGMGGRPFPIYKFRSMISEAEKNTGPVWAGKNDPRITRVGAIIRKTHLDEIPQFINVLRGEMSVVGPRPERPKIVEELKKVYPFFEKRLTLKPGITGWAQVKLDYVDTVENIADRLRYDFFYMENQSLFLDIEIMLRTMIVMITGKGAH